MSESPTPSAPSDVRTRLNEYVAEALSLRFGIQLNAADLAPTDLLATLRDVRTRLDRVELLLGNGVRIRARTRRAAAHAQALVDDAWDQAIHRSRAAAAARGEEFISARERYADANLTVLDQRRAARAAGELADAADEAHDVLRLAHRGLGDLRQDVLTLLRTYQFESTLER